MNLYKIIRNYVRFFVSLIVHLICLLIFIVTYEPFQWKKVTKRKIRRIRALTKFKIWIFKHFPKTLQYLGKYNYYEKLSKKYGL